MKNDRFLEEAIPLVAGDLRKARARLGLTSTTAAMRAGISASRYRMFESGATRNPDEDLAEMVSVAGHLGLASVRIFYMHVIDRHIRLSARGIFAVPRYLHSQHPEGSRLLV